MSCAFSAISPPPTASASLAVTCISFRFAFRAPSSSETSDLCIFGLPSRPVNNEGSCRGSAQKGAIALVSPSRLSMTVSTASPSSMSLNKLASCIRHAYTRERAQSLSKTGDTDAPRLDVVGVTSLQYDIDPETGFMPREEPVQRLGGAGELWETCWDRSSGVPLHTAGGKGETWRAEVDAMVTLDDLSFLSSMQLLRRARAVLTFIAHRYAFSMPEGADPSFVPTIPDGIAVPLLEISQQLDMPPVLTYSECVGFSHTSTLFAEHRTATSSTTGDGEIRRRASRSTTSISHRASPRRHQSGTSTSSACV